MPTAIPQVQNVLGLYDSLVLALIFAFVALAFYLLGRYLTGRPLREDARLKQISHDSPYNGEPEAGVFGSWAPALAAQLPESQAEQKEFRQMLRQAGIYHPRASETIYALRFVLLVAPLIVAGILAVLVDGKYTTPILVTGVIVAAILMVMPRLYVYFRRRRQMQKIRDGLADVIDMLGMCVSGGLPLSDGLEQVARRMTAYPECANELLLLKRQAELGGIKHALEDFTQRVDLPEASQLASLLLRNTSLGTELVGSLTLQADHLRLARRQAALTEANKTPVKLIFPIMFCFAPAVLLLLTAPAIMQLQDYLRGSTSSDTIKNVISNQQLMPKKFVSPVGGSK
ncbi:MAG: type II secretion system F family protein [Planctomycetota bacterium]